jgi:voltage-dependent calcium channel L type alpha-1D
MEISEEKGSSLFSALRAFRLFKIFKLFQVGDLRILIDSIAFTITTIGDYVVLLCLFIYVFALLGMSFFAGKVTFDEDNKPLSKAEGGISPRNNFDEILDSLLTIF